MVQKNVTWVPPEAPALLVPASASDHCHPLGTHVWNGTNFRHWPSGWMDNVILTLARQDTPSLESTTRQREKPQRRAIKGSAWSILSPLLRLISQIHAIREVLGCMCGPVETVVTPFYDPCYALFHPNWVFHNDGKMRLWSGWEGFSYFLPDDNFSCATTTNKSRRNLSQFYFTDELVRIKVWVGTHLTFVILVLRLCIWYFLLGNV